MIWHGDEVIEEFIACPTMRSSVEQDIWKLSDIDKHNRILCLGSVKRNLCINTLQIKICIGVTEKDKVSNKESNGMEKHFWLNVVVILAILVSDLKACISFASFENHQFLLKLKIETIL